MTHQPLTSTQLRADLDWLLPLARIAGDAAKVIYDKAQSHPDGAKSALVQQKADQSPLTEADLAAHRLIVEGLTRHTPEMPVISEESFQPDQMCTLGNRFWLVDPLDGTKEFLSGTGEFTVNIALIENRRPVLGVVYQPKTHELFWGGIALGSYRARQGESPQVIVVSPSSQPPWRVLASRRHMGPQTQALIERMGATELLQAGSSLKFCRIAAGLADFYPRLGFTSQWDTAAGQAVLEGAGGHVIDSQGQRLGYGQAEIINPYFLATALSPEKVSNWWLSR